MGTHNPWLPATQPVTQPAAASAADIAPLPTTGATQPQPALRRLEAGDQLPSFTTAVRSRVWVVGAHGGAGESTIAELLGGTETNHRWPDTGPPPAVLLTARTHAGGLDAAQVAMSAWAAGQTPHLRLIGLVLVADAPGRLPRPLADRAHIISGGVPHTWHIPWVESYRIGVDLADTPRLVRKVLTEITTILDTNTVLDTAPPNHPAQSDPAQNRPSVGETPCI